MCRLAMINRGQEGRGQEATLIRVKALIVVPNDQGKTAEPRKAPDGAGQRGGRKENLLCTNRRRKIRIRIAPLNLITYNGKTDPVAHLSHYRRSMALYNGNDTLMCRIFPSSLGDIALWWFDRLEHGSIHSWTELSEVFTTRFITNTRKPKEVDSLMALAIRSGESLKSYSARYWETYNEIDLCGEDVAISQFRFGLPVGSKLRQSLAKKPPPNMSNLMSRIEQHVRVEEDGLQP
uniref:Retrotransposon gag domain-containing protein n=1 Tax=Fagus sylvatica TaxID=28930 RepID=A0A2N9HTR1_FAGSY